MAQTDAYREYGPYAGKRPNQIAADVAVRVHVYVDRMLCIQHGCGHQQRRRNDGGGGPHHMLQRLTMTSHYISKNEKAEH